MHISWDILYYIDESSNKFIQRKNVINDDFSIIHVNIRSIPANLNNFLTHMINVDHDFSVIGFSETWPNPTNFDAYGVFGYNHVGLTRGDRKDGGVSLLISEKLMYTELQELNTAEDHIECVFMKIMYNGIAFIVGTVYRSPNCNIIDFNDAMSNILEKIGHQTCFIMGDLNVDVMKHARHPPTEKCLDVMYANYLIPVINRPTRIIMNACILIDNIFTNQYDVREYQLHGILKTDITDHFPLFVINCRKSPSSSDDGYKLTRIMNEFRTTQCVSKIQNMDWPFLDSFSDCQSYFSNFIKVI